MIRQLYNKKSFHWIYLNSIVENLDFSNTTIVDIGGGDKKSSYHKILGSKNNKFISVDITKDSDFKIDLEQEKLPFDDNSVDVIFCFNVMEHIFNYQHLLDELHRILKPNGKFYFYVPFLINKHADPYDFFRYTDTALHRLFTNTGFENLEVNRLSGSGKNIHTSLSWIISNNKLFFVGRVANVFSGLFFSFLDKVLDTFSITKPINEKFILGIFITSNKKEMKV